MKLYPSIGTAMNSSIAVELDCNIVETIGKYETLFGKIPLHFVKVDKPMIFKMGDKEIETYTALLANE